MSIKTGEIQTNPSQCHGLAGNAELFIEIDWSAMRPAVFDGFHRCLPVLAEAGNNLIVEHIIENEMWMLDLVKLLTGLDVFFVSVHCPLPELERRERERGNRRVGEARTDYRAVHSFAEYDLEVDSMQPCKTNVNTLVDAWKSRQPLAHLTEWLREKALADLGDSFLCPEYSELPIPMM